MTPSPQTLWKRKLVLYLFETVTAAPAPWPGAPFTVNSGPGNGQPLILDLSVLRATFKITATTTDTPNTALLRLYNLSDATARKLKGEFQYIVLMAGYESGPGPYGIIFAGWIRQVTLGHVSNIDTYTDVLAADGDLAHVNAIANFSLAAGATDKQYWDAISKTFEPYGVTQGYTMDLPYATSLRGTTSFGLSRVIARQFAQSHDAEWSFQNGKLVLVPIADYIRPPDSSGEAVVLTPATGLVGFPEQTPYGITARSLLNPNIRVGGLVTLKSQGINQAFVTTSGQLLYQSGRLDGPEFKSYLAQLSEIGTYKVLVHEFSGDTRGQEWYSDIIGLAVDLSAPLGKQMHPSAAGPIVTTPTVTLGMPEVVGQ